MIRLCQVLEIFESGYYAWHKREPSQHQQDDEQLGKLIEDAHQNNRRVYGSPRVHAELKEQGVQNGAKAGSKSDARAWNQRSTQAQENENDG